jgi:hypothetical protein
MRTETLQLEQPALSVERIAGGLLRNREALLALPQDI